MATSKEETVILSRISVIAKKIQGFLIEVGCPSKQIAAYFGRRVFQSKANMMQDQSVQDYYKRQIKEYLKEGVQKYNTRRVALIHLLEKLQIENGHIEIYESELQQQKIVSKVIEKRKQAKSDEFTYKPRRLFGMGMLNQDTLEGNKSIVKDLEQIKTFERQLQESLMKTMKTKLLKRMIQQRIEEDQDDPFNRRYSGFQNLLSLESSG